MKRILPIASVVTFAVLISIAGWVTLAKGDTKDNFYWYAKCGSNEHGSKAWTGVPHWGAWESSAVEEANRDVKAHKLAYPDHSKYVYVAHSEKKPE